VGLLLAALLAGGAIAAVKLTSHSAPRATTPGHASLAGAAQQGALLNQALSSAGTGGLATTTGTLFASGIGATPVGAAAQAGHASGCARAGALSRVGRRSGMPGLARHAAIGAARCRLARRRVLAYFMLRGVDGQFSVQTPAGERALAFERGVIHSVTAGKSLTVKASDGTSWTWDLIPVTVIRDLQGTGGQSALTVGTPVWVGGPVISGAKEAKLIVVRPPQPAPATPTPTPAS
jgi:hypothetical protein